MDTDEKETPESRRSQIMEYIKKHPGTHLREIKRELGVSMGVIQYHLYTLEREKRIISRRRGLYKRFYVNLLFAEKAQEILDVLSQETERDIILSLIGYSRATQKEISEYVRISPAGVSWHMKRLIESGLVEAEREGSFTYYSARGDASEILNLLKSYHTKVWEKWADRLSEILPDLPDRGEKDDASKEGERY